MDRHVLVTSAGRRVSLVGAFRNALRPWGLRVVAGDASSLAPALYHADEAVELPLIGSGDYIPRLMEIVEQHQIGIVVPTIDTELAMLAEARDMFESRGCTVVVSTPDVVAMSADKSLTQDFMQQHDIDVPRGWTLETLKTLKTSDLPDALFVKPRDGSSSQHCFKATRENLSQVLGMVPNPIIQQRLHGEEITIDALLDLAGSPVHLVPRKRIRTMAGESIQGVTIDDEQLRPWLLSVLGKLSALGARGPMTLQAFLTSDGPVLIEVNPRFGGGFPLTNAAGGTYAQWLVDMVAGRPVPSRFGVYRRGLYMTRYYAETYTQAPPW